MRPSSCANTVQPMTPIQRERWRRAKAQARAVRDRHRAAGVAPRRAALTLFRLLKEALRS